LVLLKVIILNVVEGIIRKGAKLLHSWGFEPTCLMENMFFVLHDMTSLGCKNITMDEENQNEKLLGDQDG
jgi:hypothetical protein